MLYALQLQGKAEGEKQIKILQTKLKYLNYCATPGDEFCHHMVEIDAQNTATKWLIAIKINAKVGITINLFVRRVSISDVGTNLIPIMTF